VIQSLVLFHTFLALAAPPAPKPASTDFIYVNGGFSASTNYEDNEYDLAAFHEYLFGGKGTLLNASGPGAMTIETSDTMIVRRGTEGYALRKPSIITAPTKPAKKEILKETLSKTKAAKLTLVFGDHGGTDGVELWDETMGPKDYSALLDTLPKSTLVRSLHFHCYSGTMVADPRRVVPLSDPLFSQFMQAQYKPNRCAFSESSEVENSWVHTPEYMGESAWARLLRKQPHPSMNDFRRYLEDDKKTVSTPMSTSDYFVDDIFRFQCQGVKKSVLPADECYQQTFDDPFKKVDATAESIEAVVCGSCGSAMVDELDARISHLDTVDSDLTRVKMRFVRKYIEENWAAVAPVGAPPFAQYVKILEELESLNTKFSSLASGVHATPEDEKRYSALIRAVPVDYSMLSADISRRPAFHGYWRKNFNSKWLEENAKTFPTIAKYLASSQDIDPVTLGDNINALMRKTQKKRKELAIALKNKKRTLVEEWLSRKPHVQLKALYDGIQACEASPLN